MSGLPVVLAVDLGGTAMKGAVVGEDGVTVAESTLATPADGILTALVALLHDLRRTAADDGHDVVGAGVATPGMLDEERGLVHYASNLGWRDVPLLDILRSELSLPVAVGHDVRAAGLAERSSGAARGFGDFALVPIGTGVAAALVSSGGAVTGATGAAGEFGHIPVTLDGPTCLCGSHGCLEAYTSNIATLKRYLGRDLSPAQTRDLLRTSGLTIGDVVARCLAGEARACATLDETAHFLGIGLATIINALNPAQIIVGGEITAAWDRIAPIIREEIAKRALTLAAGATPIVPEPAGASPRLRGATALVTAPVFAAPQVA